GLSAARIRDNRPQSRRPEAAAAAPPRIVRTPRSPPRRGCHVRRSAPPYASRIDLLPPPPKTVVTMTERFAEPLLLLAAGLAADAWFGDMPAVFARIPHPIVLAGRAIAFCDRKLNRETRSDAARWVRGIITVAVLVAGAAASGFVIDWLC